eukprot:TRINITY_DN8_c1_g1_i1.p1 TRINITY_DN8_c1_g1~~TRINITY_DN8_c1_g1_i1.p1  ORF type:complete len:1040 (-),score=452.43 TRINITY_DN8_c1_g1_i1:165-3284(-)
MGDVNTEALVDFVTKRDEDNHKTLKDFGGIDGLAKSLNSDTKKGIDAGSVEERKQKYGPNSFPEKPPTSLFVFWFDALKDKTLIILMVAAVLSIVLEVVTATPQKRKTAWIEGTAILIAVFLVSGVTATNDWSKDKKFRALSAANEDRKTKVIRGGSEQVVSSLEIVVGDVVVLETGDFIPADLLYIKGQDPQVDESSMTGEPEAVHKTADEDPYLLSGCMMMDGTVRGLAIAVGENSQWGKIRKNLETEEVQTPLQIKLEDLAETIGKVGLGAALATLVILIIRFCVKHFAQEKSGWKSEYAGELVKFVIVSVSIIAVAVPEGLPLAVTLSLAYSMVKMMKDQNLVRHLAACETMGGANAICSDKTGTLTQNRMKVVRLWLAGEKYDDKLPKKDEIKNEEALRLLCEGAAINSSAYIENEESEKPNYVGSKTDCALLLMSKKLGFDYNKIREENPTDIVYTFSSKKKRMSSVAKGKDGKSLYYCKGASEVVLELCTKVMNGDKPEDLSDEKKKEYLDIIQTWAKEGLRTLCLTYKEASSNLPKDDKEGKEDKDLTLVGIVGIEDPLRPEVKNSVKTCQKAGITIRMLTGDNLLTAQSIGKQCGILTEGGIALEGPKFRNMSEAEIDEVIPKLQIIARCSPDDKLILVKRLRALGGIVAVTGDGTNDAPALKEADVGFAMGIAGTEVAKDASDIILMDDNFSSIEKAVLWGRNVYDSIRKFIQFQLTVNVVAVTVAVISAATGAGEPLTPIELLWVNLIMDTFAALALATETPQPELMNKSPRGRDSRLISWKMWRFIAGHAAFQLGIMFWILYLLDLDFPSKLIGYDPQSVDPPAENVRNTILFNTFVFCQLFNEINARRLGNELNVFAHFFSNWIYIGIWVFTAGVQVLLITFGEAIAETRPLTLKQWAFCLAVASMELPFGLLLKVIPVPEEKSGAEGAQSGVKAKSDEKEPLLSSLGRRGSTASQGTLSYSGKSEDRDLESGEGGEKGWGKAKRNVMPKIRVVSALRRAKPAQFTVSLSRQASRSGPSDFDRMRG